MRFFSVCSGYVKDNGYEWLVFLLISYCKGAPYAFQLQEGGSVTLPALSTSTMCTEK